MQKTAWTERYRNNIHQLWHHLLTHDPYWGLLAGGIPFLIYLQTMAPTVYGLDSAELTTGAYVLGIVHAPGSPLYLLIAHLFTWLPIGDVGYRVNLLSACATAVTMLFVYYICRHFSIRRSLALTITWFIAFTYYVWILALVAELYALQGTFTTGLLLLALKWRERSNPRLLYALAFLFGLGLGNHLSLSLLAPGFAILVLTAKKPIWQQPRQIAVVTVLGLLGASIYLYLPLRYASDTPLNYAYYWGVDLTTWHGFWWMITGRMFGSLFFAVPPQSIPLEMLTFFHQLVSNFVGLGFLIGLLGLIKDWSRRPHFHLALLSMFTIHIGFYITYLAGDKDLMFLPAYLIWGIWFGLGVQIISLWLAPHIQKTFPNLVTFFVLLMAIGTLIMNYTYADVSQDWSARELGETIFEEIEDQSIYLGTWGDAPILEYLQIVEGQRPDVTILNLFFIDQDYAIELVSTSLANDVSVYTSSPGFWADLFEYSYLDKCNCYQLE